MHCYLSKNQCRKIPTCSITDGTSANAAACACGSVDCETAGTTGMFCRESENRCRKGPTCSITDGSSANPAACACGSVDCVMAETTGMFCYKSENRCSQSANTTGAWYVEWYVIVMVPLFVIMLFIAICRRRASRRRRQRIQNNNNMGQATAVAMPMVGVNQVELAPIQNPSFVAKRTRSEYFVENSKEEEKEEEEEDRRALFHALDRFRKQEAVPDILAGMRTMKDLFDPPDRIVAAFLACPEDMDAAVQDLIDASTRKMTTLGEKTWAQHIAPTYGAMLRALKSAQALLLLRRGRKIEED